MTSSHAAAPRRRVLMLVWTGVATDTRVLREASALVEAGYDVHIVGRAIPDDFSPPAGITTSSVGRAPRAAGRSKPMSLPTRAVRWALLPTYVNRRLRAWQEAAYAAALAWVDQAGPPTVVHAHDYTALPVGDRLRREFGVPLVYDTHEYWVGRPREGRPTPLGRRLEARRESDLGGTSDAVITVGDGVAGALRTDHPTWPPITVVRNTFPAASSAASAVTSPAAVVPIAPTGAVYAGRLAADRELEVIAAASTRVSLPITIIGPADDSWLERFDPGRVSIRPAVAVESVDTLLSAAGLALVTHSDRWANHRLAMPNKLFHALRCGVPVVATDVGELGRLVRAYGIGTLYRPGDADDLVRALEAAVAQYETLRAAVLAASEDLSWGVDQQRLLGVYEKLVDHGAGRNASA